MSENSSPRVRTLRSDITFAFALAIGLYLAWFVRDVLVLIYVSALFAVVLKPVLTGIMSIHIGKWQPGRGIAILVLMVTIGGLLTVFFMFAVPPVVSDLREFLVELPVKGPQMLDRLQHGAFPRRDTVHRLALLPGESG